MHPSHHRPAPAREAAPEDGPSDSGPSDLAYAAYSVLFFVLCLALAVALGAG